MIRIIQGDCLESLKLLPDQSVQCCVTSPPYYGLRNYEVTGQIGLENTPEEYVEKLVQVFREVKRVLKDDGTLWLNLGDTYFGSSKGFGDTKTTNKNNKGSRSLSSKAVWVKHKTLKPKDLIGIPWRVAFALQADGWYLRAENIWSKPNPMPESVKDRTTRAHETIFLLTKNKKYFYDYHSIREPIKDSSMVRVMQDVEQQNGSERAHAGKKAKIKPVLFGGSESENYKSRQYSGKKWTPDMGGGGTSMKGHKGYFKQDGTLICGALVNKKSVWTIASHGFKEAHFATFPPKLIEPCIMAGSQIGDFVLDPFFGAGTTGLVSDYLFRHCIGIELNPDYIKIASKRLQKAAGMFSEIEVV